MLSFCGPVGITARTVTETLEDTLWTDTVASVETNATETEVN